MMTNECSETSCAVVVSKRATAQLSLKELAKRVLVPVEVAAVAQVEPIAGVAAVADKPLPAMRQHLLDLATRFAIDSAHIRCLHDLDVVACKGLDDTQLVTFLHLLNDTASRWAGKVPKGHTAAIHCAWCGPVYVHASMATVLPVVNGWPRSLGCPWCAIRKAGKYIPRPPAKASI
jgi:hypothetical protein